MTYYKDPTSGRVEESYSGTPYSGWLKITQKEAKAAIRQQTIDKLRKVCPPGTRVYATIRHVSRSGMMRHISLAIVDKTDGRLRDITYNVACILDDKIADDGGIKIGGCGMDMAFSLVYSLGRALYPQGFGVDGELPDSRRVRGVRKVRAKTPAEAARMVAKGAKFFGRNGDRSGWDNDGGYSLRREFV